MNSINLAQSWKNDGVLELWYYKFGHLNVKNVHTLQNVLSEMNLGQIVNPTSLPSCEACMEGKQHTTSLLNHRGRQTIKSFEIIHLDVCNPMRDAVLWRMV